jgi:SSS family solute:Na+ symporter
MPDWLIALLVTLSYLVASLVVGLLSKGRSSNTTEGYVAGDRALGFFVLYFVMGGTIFSAFAFLGAPGWAYSRGAASFYIISYLTIGLVPWYFFGPKVSRLGERFGYVTQAEFFAHRYQSRPIQALLAVLSLAAFVPYLTLQMQGAGYVISVVTEGRVPEWAGAAVAYIVVLIYVFQSGMVGVAWTNTFQGILMMGLAWGLGVYLPHRLYGGVGPMFERLAAEAPQLLTAPGLNAAGTAPWSWGGYSSAVAISAIGFSVWPHYFMKIFTARDIWILKRTVVFYPTFQIFLLPILFIGYSGVLSFPGVTPADTILPRIVTSMDLPPVVVGLFCAGALAASMSTGDALVHAAGSIAVKDFYRVLFKPDLDPRSEIRLIKALVIVSGAVAYYFAVVSQASLVTLLLLSYGWIAQLFPALMAAVYWRRSTGPGVLAGLGAGGLATLVWNLFPALQLGEVHPGIWGLGANVVCLVGVSLLTAPMDREHVQTFVDA